MSNNTSAYIKCAHKKKFIKEIFTYKSISISKVLYFAGKMWYVANDSNTDKHYMIYFGHSRPHALAFYNYLYYNKYDTEIIDVIEFDSLDMLPSTTVDIEDVVVIVNDYVVTDSATILFGNIVDESYKRSLNDNIRSHLSIRIDNYQEYKNFISDMVNNSSLLPFASYSFSNNASLSVNFMAYMFGIVSNIMKSSERFGIVCKKAFLPTETILDRQHHMGIILYQNDCVNQNAMNGLLYQLHTILDPIIITYCATNNKVVDFHYRYLPWFSYLSSVDYFNTSIRKIDIDNIKKSDDNDIVLIGHALQFGNITSFINNIVDRNKEDVIYFDNINQSPNTTITSILCATNDSLEKSANTGKYESSTISNLDLKWEKCYNNCIPIEHHDHSIISDDILNILKYTIDDSLSEVLSGLSNNGGDNDEA